MLIQSRQNPLIKKLAKLASDSRTRREEGLLLAEGIHLVRDALSWNAGVVNVIYTPKASENQEVRGIINQAQAAGTQLTEVTEECYQRFSTLKSPEGIAALVAFEPIDPEFLFEPPIRLVILAGIQDPGNAGAVLRTAEAAGATGAIFCFGVDPSHPAFVRAAMGSSFRLLTASDEIESLISRCRSHGVRVIVSASEGKETYLEADYSAPAAIVIGSEGAGAGEEFIAAADQLVSIPMSGMVESLNAGVAAGVLLYQARLQWIAKQQ